MCRSKKSATRSPCFRDAMNQSNASTSSTLNKGSWMALLAAFLGWMFDGMEMGIFPLVARPALIEMASGLAGPELDKFVGMWMAPTQARLRTPTACCSP